jgi:fructokinase
MKEPPPELVLCFGEILWDSLSAGLFPGGAPVNVAYHLHRLGVDAIPLSAVGDDVLGEELLRRLKHWGLPADCVTTVSGKRTGFARVAGDGAGPVFDIMEDAAWDYIEVNAAALALATRARVIVFGSLAQRSEHNRRGLAKLLEDGKKALKIFDVNLRSPFDDAELVWRLAAGADVIKLNDDELGRLMGSLIKVEHLESAARDFAAKAGGAIVCVTAGASGAGLLVDGNWHWEPALEIKVADTVGAGDAFLAALTQGICHREIQPRELLRRACRLAEFVASRAGATPPYEMNAAGEILPRQ